MNIMFVLGGLVLLFLVFKSDPGIVLAIVLIGGAYLAIQAGIVTDGRLLVGVVGAIALVWTFQNIGDGRKAMRSARSSGQRAYVAGYSVGWVVAYAFGGFVLYVIGKVNGWW